LITVGCVATVLASLLLSTFGYSWRQIFATLVLLDICLYPTIRYFKNNERGLPVMPLLGIAFAAQYVLPIFTAESKFEILYDFVYLSDADVMAALLLTIVGVGAMQLAYYKVKNKRLVSALPTINLDLNKRKAEIYCGLVVVTMLLLSRLEGIVAEEYQPQLSAVFTLLQNQSLVAIGILGWIVYSSRGRLWHRLLLYFIVGLASIRGFSSTMLEQLLIPVAALLMTRWVFTRRLPVVALVTLGLLVVFLSPVKKNIRTNLLEQSDYQTQGSQATGVANWVEEASDYWIETIKGERTLVESTTDAATRTDLVHELAYIYSLTPSVVPYQYGSTYSYLVVTLVPRLIWPEKPKANYANNFYAIEYGISTEEGVQASTFGITLLGEAYVNFGILGVLLIMALIGFVLGLLESIVAGSRAGVGGQALFIVFVVYLLNGIGSSAEIVFGGILQNMLCSCALLWWVVDKHASKRRPASGIVLTQRGSYLQQRPTPSGLDLDA